MSELNLIPEPDGMFYEVADDLRRVRAFVTERALALGLSAGRVEVLTLAVSELTTNTLQHTSGLFSHTGGGFTESRDRKS